MNINQHDDETDEKPSQIDCDSQHLDAISVVQAAPPTTFRCVDVITKRAFQFEIPADGKGDLTFLAGFPVKSRGKLPMTYYFSETTFRFGSEVEGGMFRNGIFYYHRHDTGTGTKIVSGTCRVI